MIDGHESLKAAHDALNIAAQGALADKEQKIQDAETRLRNLIFRQQFDLLDANELKTDKFRGLATEPFKPWQRKFKAFCNSKRWGFRAALEWAEKESTPIVDLSTVPWNPRRSRSSQTPRFPLADSR